jgi:hypothetical protein
MKKLIAAAVFALVGLIGTASAAHAGTTSEFSASKAKGCWNGTIWNVCR